MILVRERSFDQMSRIVPWPVISTCNFLLQVEPGRRWETLQLMKIPQIGESPLGINDRKVDV